MRDIAVGVTTGVEIDADTRCLVEAAAAGESVRTRRFAVARSALAEPFDADLA
jgi:hypothetical protein